MTAGLLVRELSHTYTGSTSPVLRGVDLEVAPGTLTAVVGPSGCGKTTLLRLIAGFERPGTGTVEVAGRLVTWPGGVVPPERRRIGYVTQEGALFPHLTVAGNVAFGLPRRARRDRGRITALLELVGLAPDFAGRHPAELSGGEQQRVALARALAPEPELVLLDEPFSALDPELRAGTRRAVADALSATGTTTVLVTHDRAEALSLAARVAVLHGGTVRQEGRPTTLYRRPADPVVAAFLGEVVTLPVTGRRPVVTTPLGPVPEGDDDRGDTISVRPEQIVLDGGVAAEVLAVEFEGHSAAVRLRPLPDGPVVTARCAGHLVPDVGDVVRARITGRPL
jgi:iron(III) transport system ATP-binding protein